MEIVFSVILSESLHVSLQGCEHFVLMHISNIEHPSYQITIQFHDLSFPSVIKVRNILFMVSSPKYIPCNLKFMY